jgi:hypothetical protein
MTKWMMVTILGQREATVKEEIDYEIKLGRFPMDMNEETRIQKENEKDSERKIKEVEIKKKIEERADNKTNSTSSNVKKPVINPVTHRRSKPELVNGMKQVGYLSQFFYQGNFTTSGDV